MTGIRVTNKAHSKNRFKTGYSTQVGYNIILKRSLTY